MASASVYRSVGNWSVSQPSSRSPRLASIEPSSPASAATCSSCIKRVAGQRRVVRLDVELEVLVEAVARAGRRCTVGASKSYWCVVGSFGFGSIRNWPVKPIFFV